MATVNKENVTKVMKNVVVAYAKIAEASKKYESEDTEYTIDCVVDKPTAKQWNKDFPKQKAKEFDLEEFEQKFKMESPYSGDEVYVIKLKKGATKNGEAFDEKFRPKVFLDTNEDGVRVRTDITVSRLIGNGTIADVSYRVNENKFGVFAQLNNIRINEENFKEYISTGGKGAGSEFDGDDEAPVEKRKEPENKAATQARASKAKAKPEPEEEDDDDQSSPF